MTNAQPKANYRLMLVADEIHFRRGMGEEQVLKAIKGGVTIVQLREKICSDREFLSLARKLIRAIRDTGVPLIINDRTRVAKLAGARGVHLGQKDDSSEFARSILGSEAIIGLSVENLRQVQEANLKPVDYLGVSSVFQTSTKKDLQTHWGISGILEIRKLTPIPLIGIGGITEMNAASVISSGAKGIAVISNFRHGEDWEHQAKILAREIERGKVDDSFSSKSFDDRRI